MILVSNEPTMNFLALRLVSKALPTILHPFHLIPYSNDLVAL